MTHTVGFQENADDDDGDELHEECGVFGVYAPDTPVAYVTFDGLFALQHRGQESAGMAVADGEEIVVVRDMGLVSAVFDDRTLRPLRGDIAIGHVRYSTAGSSTWSNAQPVYRGTTFGAGVALAHNGNLTNTEMLSQQLESESSVQGSDSHLVAEMLSQVMDEKGDSPSALREALFELAPSLEGAYSFVACDAKHLVGLRDPNGFRPLCLGRLGAGWVLASETPALDIVGAHFIREIEPGEMVVIDQSGVTSFRPYQPDRIEPKLCMMEFVYFARPDSQLYGKELHGSRRRMGELLADQAPIPSSERHFDKPVMVMGVPESGVPAAEGYAYRSGIPLGQGLVKNRYIGRTFISPTAEARAQGVRRKLNPLHDNVAGKRLVVVDDSVVRGTTLRGIVNLLRDAGAAEVHLRITSPPYKWPCFFGINVGTRAELIAANLELEDIRAYFGVESLAYLTLDNLRKAIAAPGAGFCDACFTGNYPITVRDREIEGKRDESMASE